jgi:hypothetical protein
MSHRTWGCVCKCWAITSMACAQHHACREESVPELGTQSLQRSAGGADVPGARRGCTLCRGSDSARGNWHNATGHLFAAWHKAQSYRTPVCGMAAAGDIAVGRLAHFASGMKSAAGNHGSFAIAPAHCAWGLWCAGLLEVLLESAMCSGAPAQAQKRVQHHDLCVAWSGEEDASERTLCLATPGARPG